MTRVLLMQCALAAILAAGLFGGSVWADWSEDFSGPLTNWDEYTFDPFEPYGADSISLGVVDGKLVFDAHLPFPGDAGENNNAAGYSVLILNDPAFEDPEDVEVTCVVEIGGSTEQLYGGIIARAQNIQFDPGEILVGGVAYAYLLSGSGQGEAGLYKVYDHADDYVAGVDLEDVDPSYETRIENEPVYLKMKITTDAGTGYPHVEAMMSFSANFADPFGIIDYIDDGTEGPMITGPGKVGLVGFNDYEPEVPLAATVMIDDLTIITEFLDLGDANGDGFVNSADLDIVRANWGATVTPGNALMGDLSGDGVVNSADLDLVRGNWGNAYAAAVPEPGICILAALGAFVCAFGRRRN